VQQYDVPIERVVCCGGIAEKNDLFMQIYADVIACRCSRPLAQTPAWAPASRRWPRAARPGL